MCPSLNAERSAEPRWPDVPNATRWVGSDGSGTLVVRTEERLDVDEARRVGGLAGARMLAHRDSGSVVAGWTYGTAGFGHGVGTVAGQFGIVPGPRDPYHGRTRASTSYGARPSPPASSGGRIHEPAMPWTGGGSFMATVTFDHVVKRYGEVTAVSDLNLEIRDGEFMVLVGPSGCGKSTALRMIAGLEESPIGDDPDRRARRQRRAPQGPRHRDGLPELRALPAHDRVRQPRVRPQARARRRKDEIDQRVKDAASTLGTRRRSSTASPRRSRAASASASRSGARIVRKPSVFLFDEPLSNLDAKLRVQMRAEITSCTSELETTTVYVTHDQLEAMTIGDRIAVMKAGVLQQVDSPLAVYDAPGEPLRRGLPRQPVDELPARPRSAKATT